MSRAGPVRLVASRRERVELVELSVVEAELVALVRRDRLLVGAAVGGGTDRDLLEARRALEHRARPVDAEGVGDDAAGDDDLTETPRRLDRAARRRR